MNFLRSRSEQLADYLSNSIARAELVEPLPGMRDWAVKLGVSYRTLESALKIVERRGLVSIEPRRGVRLRRARGASRGIS
ncbi:MAG: GntR family transcriptional regulator [Verrucomicrobia bacterium]|nr:GntR family transcriptional regulator [Verrucomicrobiota bacterium]